MRRSVMLIASSSPPHPRNRSSNPPSRKYESRPITEHASGEHDEFLLRLAIWQALRWSLRHEIPIAAAHRPRFIGRDIDHTTIRLGDVDAASAKLDLLFERIADDEVGVGEDEYRPRGLPRGDVESPAPVEWSRVIAEQGSGDCSTPGFESTRGTLSCWKTMTSSSGSRSSQRITARRLSRRSALPLSR